MTITLQLPPELAERLIADAARRRQSVEEYILALVARTGQSDGDSESDGNCPPVEPAAGKAPGWDEVIRRLETGYEPSGEERRRVILELIQSVHTGVSLSDDELSRETMYDDR